MKVHVTKKTAQQVLDIETEFIKLESALKYASMVATGGEAKAVILDGMVTVNGEVCLMRGKKLRDGDSFAFGGESYLVKSHVSV